MSENGGFGGGTPVAPAHQQSLWERVELLEARVAKLEAPFQVVNSGVVIPEPEPEPAPSQGELDRQLAEADADHVAESQAEPSPAPEPTPAPSPEPTPAPAPASEPPAAPN